MSAALVRARLKEAARRHPKCTDGIRMVRAAVAYELATPGAFYPWTLRKLERLIVKFQKVVDAEEWTPAWKRRERKAVAA